jgi:hypothetical protein
MLDAKNQQEQRGASRRGSQQGQNVDPFNRLSARDGGAFFTSRTLQQINNNCIKNYSN